MHEPLIIKFDGDLATRHLLPLYEGGESLSGIGLSFTRVSHYLLTGEVRQRSPYDSRLKIITRAPQQGSIEFDFIGFLAGPAPTSTIGQITISVSASLIFCTGVYLIKKLVGKPSSIPNSLKELEERRPGDLDALSSAILPSVKKAHTIVSHGAGSININGDNNNVVLNSVTKEYIHTTVRDGQDTWIDASVGWLNANQRTGGAYIYEYGRIIPFDISKNISNFSLHAISKSHSDYFLGQKDKSRISLRVLADRSIDGTIKRYLLLEAQEIDERPI